MGNWSTRIALSLALGLPSAAPATPPQRVEITFEVAHSSGLVLAEVTERLEHDGRTYRLEESWNGRGVFALRGEAHRSSRGTLEAGALRPLEYEDRRSGRDTGRASFSWNTKTLTLQYKGDPQRRPLEPGTQDRLSLLWSFTFKPPGKQPVTVYVADGKGVSTHIYDPAGRERIRVPAGEFEALKLVRRKDGPQDRGAEVWLAADRDYLPVRILLTEKDGTHLDQTAVRIALP